MAQASHARWSHERLGRLIKFPPRYENSLYGPLNAIFADIFSPSRGFIICPQPIVQERTIIESHPAAPSTASGPSFIDPVLETNPESVKIWIPDFIIVKGREVMGTASDLVLALIEVKNNAAKRDAYMRQVTNYLDALPIETCSNGFVAYLIMGGETVIWRSEGQGANRTRVRGSVAIHTGGRAFLSGLSALG
ncbi:hypothetical protein SCP_0200790 [Sparassis crispa]|uniref:Fungal-type protein kinase domain-containing protein n=1 Tax=Sparassis crispa TaxID=139825 RepID=A0A401G9N8_9APHY|nr:hypothetical protein SCP_0200790 [Sparassis crispa]GBE78882.1 hypothetical protein SCP_0200790 [Sparassis crispa]